MEPRFSASERELLRNAVEDAQALTGRFYHVSPREWAAHPFDVMTAGEAGNVDVDSMPAGALAAVVRVDLASRGRGRPSRIYRIVVDEPRIVEAGRRRGAGVELGPLLLYLMAHEMVHVVRFGLLESRFDAKDREREEARVYALTERVLEPAMEPGLVRVVEAYRKHKELYRPRDGKTEGADVAQAG